MSNIAIKVENLSKRYRIGLKEELHDTFTGALASFIKSPFANFKNLRKLSKFGENSKAEDDIIWALKDVSFEVNHGEVVGIIGRNGAGKSTLLKILSRITEPTSGRVTLNGRVSSLLEVGTGFHPELSGRENIYLNGTILGMTKREIDSKFDEIVDFSGVEKFIDTPVKRYSSGMQVRLAFAVAAHLEPEILVIDEVLAVGDYEFQKKCLGKMQDVAGSGRTVLFVSHNMNAVKQLCHRGIMLNKGKLHFDQRNLNDLIKRYLTNLDTDNNSSSIWVNKDNRFVNPWFQPTNFYIGDKDGNRKDVDQLYESKLHIFIEGIVNEIEPALQIGYSIYNEEGILIYHTCFRDSQISEWPTIIKGHVTLRTKLPQIGLKKGKYILKLLNFIHNREFLCKEPECPEIVINIQNDSQNSPMMFNERDGILTPILEWEIFKKNESTQNNWHFVNSNK